MYINSAFLVFVHLKLTLVIQSLKRKGVCPIILWTHSSFWGSYITFLLDSFSPVIEITLRQSQTL